jgi:hypothetical protein
MVVDRLLVTAGQLAGQAEIVERFGLSEQVADLAVEMQRLAQVGGRGGNIAELPGVDAEHDELRGLTVLVADRPEFVQRGLVA